MKALTLWQPWASLVALCVKTTETRSWATKYRGEIGIHAALKLPPVHELGDWAITYGRLTGWFMESPDGEFHDLHFGAVVATATLVDCVPMISEMQWRLDGWGSGSVVVADTSIPGPETVALSR